MQQTIQNVTEYRHQKKLSDTLQHQNDLQLQQQFLNKRDQDIEKQRNDIEQRDSKIYNHFLVSTF
jgi:hypothetical protein